MQVTKYKLTKKVNFVGRTRALPVCTPLNGYSFIKFSVIRVEDWGLRTMNSRLRTKVEELRAID